MLNRFPFQTVFFYFLVIKKTETKCTVLLFQQNVNFFLDNNQISIFKLSYEGSCVTKDRSNDAENSALRHKYEMY